jgi:hypothetical protein
MSVLTDLDALRRRTRGDRHAYAFPLFLFGGLILLAPICYESLSTPFESTDLGPFPQFTPTGLLMYPALVGWYWILTIVGGLWLTNWWYRHRARKQGVETDVRVPTAVAGAALFGFLVWPVFSGVFGPVGLYSRPAVNLPILFGCAAIAAVIALWARRRGSTAGFAVATFFATVSFGAVGVYCIRGHAALVVIAAALLVLAWAERSVPLTVVAGLFAGSAMLVNLYNLENVCHRIGWVSDGWDERVTAWQNLLLPGLILLVGGAVTVIGNRR